MTAHSVIRNRSHFLSITLYLNARHHLIHELRVVSEWLSVISLVAQGRFETGSERIRRQTGRHRETYRYIETGTIIGIKIWNKNIFALYPNTRKGIN